MFLLNFGDIICFRVSGGGWDVRVWLFQCNQSRRLTCNRLPNYPYKSRLACDVLVHAKNNGTSDWIQKTAETQEEITCNICKPRCGPAWVGVQPAPSFVGHLRCASWRVNRCACVVLQARNNNALQSGLHASLSDRPPYITLYTML